MLVLSAGLVPGEPNNSGPVKCEEPPAQPAARKRSTSSGYALYRGYPGAFVTFSACQI
jgi:hypothetical protein